MEPIAMEVLVEIAIQFLIFFVIGCIGAFLKDAYDSITAKHDKMRLLETLIGGFSAAFISLAIEDIWLKELSLRLLFLATFIIGIVGFELFGKFSTLAGLRKTADEIIEYRAKVKGGQIGKKN